MRCILVDGTHSDICARGAPYLPEARKFVCWCGDVPPLLESSREAFKMLSQISNRIVYAILIADILAGTAGVTMSDFNAREFAVKFQEDEGLSMFHRRAGSGTALVTSEIAFRLAEMVLIEVYGKEYMEERAPLRITDDGDRWEVRSREGITPGERLLVVIMKRNARIFELTSY